jgi:hypothetical protein
LDLELSGSGYEVHRIGGSGRQAIRVSEECLNEYWNTEKRRNCDVSPWDKPEYRSFAQEEAPGGTGMLRMFWPSLPIAMGDAMPYARSPSCHAYWAACLSDVVLIMLGTNDASLLGKNVCATRFVSDYVAIVGQYTQTDGKQPRILLAMSPQPTDLKGNSAYSRSGSSPGAKCPEDCPPVRTCFLGCKVATRAQMWPGWRAPCCRVLSYTGAAWNCPESTHPRPLTLVF